MTEAFTMFALTGELTPSDRTANESCGPPPGPVLTRDELLQRLRTEGTARYHDQHPFHVAMHEGQLSRQQLEAWVINRYYYQTRIPIKDALIVAKADDAGFRRMWLRRIVDHDGAQAGEGGLELWLRLGEALGVKRERMVDGRDVLPGVRFACDAYVNLVRDASLVEAVASSLTEFFAPDLMTRRLAAFEQHYSFVNPQALEYFRQRVPRAKRDSNEAIEFVLENANTLPLQEACVRALIRKTEILWHLLDCVQWNAGTLSKLETEPAGGGVQKSSPSNEVTA
jgi:pyrroloquinoline-quinone synthase